jgi:hypothetical protein
MNIVQVGLEKEKAPKRERNDIAKVIKERLVPIKDKNAQKVIDKLLNHLDRKLNINIDTDEKREEIKELQEQSRALENQYQEDFNRDTMKAKVEIDNEIALIKDEVQALVKKQSHGVHAWKIELNSQDVEAIVKGYQPHGEKEQKLYADLVKAKDTFVKCFAAFNDERNKNIDLHNNVFALLEQQAGQIVQLNRVSDQEVYAIRQEVSKL